MTYSGEAALLWLVAIGVLWIVAHISNKRKAKEQEKEEPKEKIVYLKVYLQDEEKK